MSYSLEYFKNKFKRLVIEVHHRKNKISNREHIIHIKDPTKPFITLRVDNENSEYEDIESTDGEVEPEHFDGFSSFSKSQEDLVVESRVSSFTRRTRPLNIISRPSTPTDSNQAHLEMLEHQKRLEDTLKGHINYIETELPPRRRFWFFGRRYPELKEGNKDSREPIELINNDNEDEDLSENNIELIAHSSKEPTDVNNNYETEPFNFQTNEKLSSYSRKKHNLSLLSLSKPSSRENCNCAACIRRQKNQLEPWKIVMNDISLHAALLSTGAKNPIQHESFNNLVADFTSSKHEFNSNYNNKRIFSSGSELVSLQTNNPLNIGKFTILNDENHVIESDLLEFSKPVTREQITNNETVAAIHQSNNNSIISDPIEYGQPTSGLYSDVFQNYEYSDESEKVQTKEEKKEKDNESIDSETQPLKVSARSFFKQIF